MKKPVVLVIMDGFGINPNHKNNAVYSAKTPNLDKFVEMYPHTQIGASGMDVGLPDGQMGNSEVGHTNIGAGRVVYQELTRITKSITDGDFFENPVLLAAMDNCLEKGTALHLAGLLSDGGVHSHNTHLWGLLELAKKKGIKEVYVHALLDGRDVPPASGIEYVKEAYKKLEEIGVGKLATMAGRYYGMDRDTQWGRVQKAYNAIAKGEGLKADCAVEALEKSYVTKDEDGKFITDEFVVPTVLGDYKGINKDDSFIFFNFRPDRAREITRTFVDDDFAGFERKGGRKKVFYVCMTQYDASMPNVEVAFKPESLVNTFGEYISNLGMTQLRIAETEKHAHVTFFFNGGVESVYKGEDRVLVNSPKVATYDLQPEMSAPEVCEKVVERIKSGNYDVIVLNFANCDMVGHTGVFDAAVKAVETVDTCVGKVVDAINSMGGVALITADHGNADQMVDYETHNPFTAHTTNVVPLILIGANDKKLKNGRLADLAPTMLDLMGLDKPGEMTGESLIEK